MALKQLVVIPIYWGSGWRPPSRPRTFIGGHIRLTDPVEAVLGENDQQFSYIDMNAAMWMIMLNPWYMRGLEEYGISPGHIEHGYILDEAPPKPTFTMDQCWKTIDEVVADGDVPAPSSWDADNAKALYALFVQPGSAYINPDEAFGYNDSYTDGASKVWVTANSDLAGGIETYAHEMVEGSTEKQIADDPNHGGHCGTTVVIDHLRLPTYYSEELGACWPSAHAVFLAESTKTVDIRDFEGIHTK